MTEDTDFLLITFALLIYFIAYIFLFLLAYTFQTLPNPPFPTGKSKLKLFFVIL